MILLAIAIATYGFSYFRFVETDFIRNKDIALRSSVLWQIAFHLHVGFGAVALLIGGFQFIAPLRDRFSQLHRQCGIVYVTSVFVSSISGFIVALFADAGPVAETGFALLAILWFTTKFEGLSSDQEWSHPTAPLMDDPQFFANICRRDVANYPSGRDRVVGP